MVLFNHAVTSYRYREYVHILYTAENIRIYHHVAEGTRESYLSVHDLQFTTGFAELFMLQIIDKRMDFLCPYNNVMIDYFLTRL